MYSVLAIISIFLGVGYSLKYVLNRLSHKIPNDASNSLSDKSSKIVECSSHFDSFQVYIFQKTNLSLETIFGIIIERYILSWYRTLSDNADFVVQVRLHLQHISAILISRAKSIDPADFLVNCIIKSLVNHAGHIYPLLSVGKRADSILEEAVLRDLGSHLHVCLSSRSAELAYLRAVVNKLLPHITLPPGLISTMGEHKETMAFTDFQSFKAHLLSPKRNASFSAHELNSGCEQLFSRSSSVTTLHSRAATPVKLGTNRAAYSFLIEILSTCVLLPALDAVANPDFINRIILQCLTEPMSQDPDVDHPSEVRVLNSYVDEWERWISEKPQCKFRLEKLIHQPEDCFSLIQYMKSVKSTIPITAVLLMHEIDQRIRTGPLPPDVCREIRAQIYHVFFLVRHSASHTPDGDAFVETGETTDADPATVSHTHSRLLLDLPEAFEQLLLRFLEKPTVASSLLRLIESPVWTNACRRAYEAVEHRFLPLYFESPECLVQQYGVSLRLLSTMANTKSDSPQRAPQSSGLFNFPLNIFSNNVVEGRVLSSTDPDFTRAAVQMSNRSPQRGQSGRNTNFRWNTGTSQPADQSSALTIDSHHQLHSHYLLHTRPRIDMSSWHVFIPGLSRPEIRPSRRLIDQLVTSGVGGSVTNNGSSRNANSTAKSVVDGGGAFRDKGSNETVPLPPPPPQSNDTRAPLLSPQFLFTVRTEHLVNGSWQPIARVDRKYSEFYVLEQKLLEFHGNAIVRQLPRKQFIPRTFEFLEAKREPFEQYLQYLLAQPFLRSSELLHGFLTSSATFSSNVLFDLNLGRFAKSVPLKLIRERGQYLDNFLVAFYLSCNPQPIVLEPCTPEPPPPPPRIAVGTGLSATLGGIDTLASPDLLYQPGSTAGGPAAQSTEPRGSQPTVSSLATNPVVARVPTNPPTVVAPVERRGGPKLTWLDNRLRMKMFWNNAGLTGDRRKELSTTRCDCETLKFDGIIELPVHLLKYLIEPVARLPDGPELFPVAQESPNSAVVSDPPPTEPQLPKPVNALQHNWDIGHEFWSEALLNGPTSIPTGHSLVPHSAAPPPVIPDPTQLQPVLPDAPCEKPAGTARTEVAEEEEKKEPHTTDTVSIGLADIVLALRNTFHVIRQLLLVRMRQFSLWALYTIHHVFQSRVDRWLSRLIDRYLRETVTSDQFMASALQLLNATLFYPYTPSTEQEKTERKAQARLALKQFVSDSKLAFLLDSKTLDESLDKLFTCFQHPKWNKQLSYVLFDQLIVALFPELLCSHPDQLISDS